ncbi:MAG: hypothetical protein ACJKTH_00840 [Patescibacteria group bacterium UBA2163]
MAFESLPDIIDAFTESNIVDEVKGGGGAAEALVAPVDRLEHLADQIEELASVDTVPNRAELQNYSDAYNYHYALMDETDEALYFLDSQIGSTIRPLVEGGYITESQFQDLVHRLNGPFRDAAAEIDNSLVVWDSYNAEYTTNPQTPYEVAQELYRVHQTAHQHLHTIANELRDIQIRQRPGF